MGASLGLLNGKPDQYFLVDFWANPEHTGWLMKQGAHIKTWRRRWFVLKSGELYWFKECNVSRDSKPRGVIPVTSCMTVKGAEDVLNEQFAFQLTTSKETMYFIADSEEEKEEWITSVGRSIVQHLRSVTEAKVVDYDSNLGRPIEWTRLRRGDKTQIEKSIVSELLRREDKSDMLRHLVEARSRRLLDPKLEKSCSLPI